MLFWKKSKESPLRRGLQECVLNGGSREELLREALAEVADGGEAHRIGIWLEPAEEERKQEGVLRGTVWDSEIAVPAREWQWLAPQTVLPPASLLSGAAVEVDMTREVKLPIVGPLAGLGRAIWAPVQLSGKLRGVLLAGTRGMRTELPRERLLDVAAKLAVALALESERKASNERHADNAQCERILARLQTNTPPERLLQEVVESCLAQSARPHNPGAAFAAIARIRHESSISEQAGVAIEFLCTGGKVDENQITAHEAVNMLVRDALESGRTSRAEIRSLSGEEFLRVIAIPLHVRGKRRNILLAGFHPAQAYLSSLERVELRGALAASVLAVMAEAETEASKEQHKSQEVAPLPTAVPDGVKEKRADAELASLAEWLDQGVILYDEHESVGLLNLRFAQMAGFEQEELEGCKTLEGLIERLKGQSANPEVFAQRWRNLAKREIGGEREEVNLVRPVARVLERASRPVLDSEGKQIGRIELYKDLTAQRVFQAKLLQTERLAALGQMVSGVAHELSNPLTSILGYAQRLLLRNDAEGNYEEIRKIFGEAERAGAILRRMLLAARETTPERKLVSLNQIVQKTIDFQRFSLAAERIRVDVCLDAMLPNVLGDAGQLQQVLINLLGNAHQAIESQGHGGTIRVCTRRTDGKHARLEVSDSGPGIPEGIMARIFDPFFTTKPAGVGTGLGLSIVLSLVREHGGHVSVWSPRGGGATFVVELPLAQMQEKTDLIVQRSAPAQSAQRSETENIAQARKLTGTRRVLVIEDEPIVAQLISDVLRDEGFDIEVLLDGRDALERTSRARFDLIICDMKMPNLDGQRLYQTLAAEEKGLSKRFLFVTGDVLGARTHEFLAKHQLPYVAKPFRVEELLEKVHQAVQSAANGSSWHITAIRQNSATAG